MKKTDKAPGFFDVQYEVIIAEKKKSLDGKKMLEEMSEILARDKEGRVVGGIFFRPCGIDTLAVHPSFQGKKIGATLFKKAFEIMIKECREVCWASRPGAVGFYTKQGAHHDPRHDGYGDLGDNEFMCKKR